MHELLRRAADGLAHAARSDTMGGKLVRLPLRLVPAGAVVPVLSGPLHGWKWVAGSANHGCWLGTYEVAKQHLFARVVRPGSVVYDVGANVGFYTLLAAALAGREGRVVAFEPLPGNIQLLRRHVTLNSADNVQVVEAAVSDSCGTARFARHASCSQGRLDLGGEIEVQTVALDDLVSSGKAPLPDVIKMDIEGGEAHALRGATQLLRARAPVILLATHGDEVRDECREILSSLGYEMEPVAGDPTGSEFVAQRVGGVSRHLCEPR